MLSEKERQLEAQIKALTNRYKMQPSYALENKIKRLKNELDAVRYSSKWEQFLSR